MTPPASARSSPPSSRPWALALLLVAITLAVHGNTLANGFVWDDDTIIVKNPDTREIGRIGHVLLSPDDRPPYYRPLNRASYLIDYQAFGMAASGFHLVNVLLQVGCVLALFALARRLFLGWAPAFVAAALLAVHPIGIEAVAFVTARNNLFALLFSLLSVTAFLDATRRDAWGAAWLSGAFFLLALGSKEPAAMMLPVMGSWLLLDGHGRTDLARRARLLLPSLLALAVYMALRIVSLGGAIGTPPGGGTTAPLVARLGANLVAIPTYVGLLLFPKNLTIYHVLPEPSPGVVTAFALAWVTLGVLAALLLRKGSRATAFGLAWFVLGLLPIANLVSLPTGTVLAERYVFIPAVGLWIVAADVFDSQWVRPGRRTAVAVGTAAVLLALAGRTVLRNRDWKDDLSLARAAVEVEPRAPMARYNLGLALQEAGDAEGALREWRESARIDRVDGRAAVALGKLAADRGDAAEAERQFRSTLGMLVGPTEGRLNLGKLHDRLGNPAAARQEWEAVLRAEPGHPDALSQLGALDASRGDLRSAEARFVAALRSDPQAPEALFNMGKLCEMTGRRAEAASYYRRFLATRAGADDEGTRIARQRLRALGAP